MNCPNCGTLIENSHVCPSCKIDIVLLKKTISISNSLYNQGLFDANTRNLSSAITKLKRSIYFNKNNVNSRNLLGLVYFETGMIANALGQWIVSSSILTENNIASEYIALMHKNERKIDALNNGISSYNQALQYIKQGSSDMAMIQLGRVAEENPNLVDAYLLLALCLMLDKRGKEANEAILKALEIDFFNPRALQYYYELNGFPAPKYKSNSTKSLHPETEVLSRPAYNRYEGIARRKPKNAFSFSFIINFMLGAVFTALLMFFLFKPSEKVGFEKKISDLEGQILKQEAANFEISQNFEILKTDLENKSTELEKTNTELNAYKTEIENKMKFNELIALYENNDFEASANMVSNVNETYLSTEEKELFLEMKTSSFSKYVDSLIVDGKNQYTWGNYSESKALFEKVFNFTENEYSITDSLYYLGRIAEFLDDNTSATSYYQRIVDDYPDSFRVADANYRLNQLN